MPAANRGTREPNRMSPDSDVPCPIAQRNRSSAPTVDVPWVRCQPETRTREVARSTRALVPVRTPTRPSPGCSAAGDPIFRVSGSCCSTTIPRPRALLGQQVDVRVDRLLGGARPTERPDAFGERVGPSVLDRRDLLPDPVLRQLGGHATCRLSRA